MTEKIRNKNILLATCFNYSRDCFFAILTTVTRHNVDDLPRIIRYAGDLGAAFLIPFFLVATGNGKTIRHHQLSHAAYEACLTLLYDLSTDRHILPAGCDMVIRPGCAPHSYRIAHQQEGSYKLSFFDKPIIDGCLAGISFLFISYSGIVQPCGYLDLPCGDVHRESLHTIWNTSPVFQNIRTPHAYQGKCGVCEFLSGEARVPRRPLPAQPSLGRAARSGDGGPLKDCARQVRTVS